MKDPNHTSSNRPPDTGHRSQATGHRPPTPDSPFIQVKDLTLAYGSKVIMRDLTFDVHQGEVLIFMGGSGSGKSTLLKSMIGLVRPAKGHIVYGGTDLWSAAESEQNRIRRRMGVLYQHGALWSSMTLSENIALPLEIYTDVSRESILELASMKLSLVGLAGQEKAYPSELSGGMQKRAALARALALDPEIVFFDEPSSGLDPLSSRRLDELILELQSSMGTTMIVVTHDLDSIFTISTRAVFLDAKEKTMAEIGDPRLMRDKSKNSDVREFLRRGE